MRFRLEASSQSNGPDFYFRESRRSARVLSLWRLIGPQLRPRHEQKSKVLEGSTEAAQLIDSLNALVSHEPPVRGMPYAHVT